MIFDSYDMTKSRQPGAASVMQKRMQEGKTILLSERLQAVVRMVPQINTVADIGCDHGKVAAWLLKNGRAKFAVCGDISAPSLEKARRLTASMGLQNAVSLRVGSGFDVLSRGEADAAVIAGMGGELMTSILEHGKEKLPDTLVLACHRDADVLRGWLSLNGFAIDDEDLVHEKGHYYPVIRAIRRQSRPLTPAETEFGPVLLAKKPRHIKNYVAQRIKQTEKIRGSLLHTEAVKKETLLRDIDARLQLYNEVNKCL